MTATQIIEKKELCIRLKNLIDESADSRLNWNGIVSKFNRPCGFIYNLIVYGIYNYPLFALVT